MSAPRKILVTGATGRQGGAVVKHLLKNNMHVRAMSRTPESSSAKLLEARGVEIVKGDMADIKSLTHAMGDCDGVFSVQNFFEYGADKEIQYGKNLADAAKQSQISQFIYSSVCGADTHTRVPHFETKNIIEQYITKTGIPFTILRPVKFMENYYIPQVFKGILGGKLYDAIKPGKKHQMIASDDIGKYAAAAFQDPGQYLSKTFSLAGDELTNEEVATVMSDVTGIKIRFSRLPMFIVKLVMENEMYQMFRWFNEHGFQANRNATRDSFPTVKTLSLKEFLIEENWQRWNKKGTV
jgi:uncharacterized protein YbjT (DUF2867 family)